MTGSDELLTLAELAIGLAGFSGIIVAFAYRGELHALDRMRFIALFSLALATVVLAFVPFGFHYAGVSETAIWRRSSGLFFVWAASHAAYLAPRLRRLALVADAAVPAWLRILLFLLTFFNILLQLLNGLGWPFAPGPIPYLGGLLLWLCGSACFFVFLVIYRPTDFAT